MPDNRLTAARHRLKAWRDKRAEEKAAPHRTAQRGMLVSLNKDRDKHVYAGTVAAKDKRARRAANKRSRKSRRTNRLKAK